MERNRKAIKSIKFVPYNIHHINIYGVYLGFFINELIYIYFMRMIEGCLFYKVSQAQKSLKKNLIIKSQKAI